MSETETIPPAIAHWLPHRGAPHTTVHWITAEGVHGSVAGRIAGWARTPSGAARLVIEVRQDRQGPTRYDRRRISAESLQRWLDANGTTRPAAVRRLNCLECGRPLGTGPNGHLYEAGASPDCCYDCA